MRQNKLISEVVELLLSVLFQSDKCSREHGMRVQIAFRYEEILAQCSWPSSADDGTIRKYHCNLITVGPHRSGRPSTTERAKVNAKSHSLK